MPIICPARDELARFSFGRLDETPAEEIGGVALQNSTASEGVPLLACPAVLLGELGSTC